MKFHTTRLAVSIAMILGAAALSACGSDSDDSPAQADTWGTGTTVGSDPSKIEPVESEWPVEPGSACNVAAGTLIFNMSRTNGSYADRYLYFWDGTDQARPGPGWPGEQITSGVIDASCAAEVYGVAPSDITSVTVTDFTGMNAIINDGNGQQTVDVNNFTPEKPCLLVEGPDASGKNQARFVTATECGVTVDGQVQPVSGEVYVVNGEAKVAAGGEIKIDERAGNPVTAYVDLTLLIKGAGVDATTQGAYWFGDDPATAVPFTNGDIIRVGQDVQVTDGTTKQVQLHVQYAPEGADPVEAVYTVVKTFTAEEPKDPQCRQNKTEDPDHPGETMLLGAIWSPTETDFRIWSPDSSDVVVSIDGVDHPMTPEDVPCYTGVYEYDDTDGDLAGHTYQFKINGEPVRDPYGKMVASGSDTANIVMDMSQTEPDGGWVDAPALANREDTIVYEVHVRDFTIDETSGVDADKRGRYLGMVQAGTTYNGVTTGLDHLKELGVTHVQLQPIYDYATCSNVDSQDSSCYNWGYDPWNYNIPEDRYSSVFGTDDYVNKIKEVKTMVNELHKNGIRVIMDVVYNHTFDKTVFEKITSKYYLNGDLSGCGNTVNADKDMVWKMIRDSMDYWVTEYHIDGFRLDLVGAFNMSDFSDWGIYLNRTHPDATLVIYGEPWTGSSDDPDQVVTTGVRTGRMWTQDPEAHVGAFNNRVRNCLKGSSDNGDNLGFVFNKENDGWDTNGNDENDQPIQGNAACVFMGAKAGMRHADATGTDEWSAQGFSDPEQTVTYITAHDNLALRDKIEAGGKTGEEARTLQAYANSILMTMQGIAFIHGGEEIGRTKAAAGADIANTYNTTTGANDFKWDLKAGDWKAVSESYAGYIGIRKAHPAFRMTNADDIFANVTLDPNSTDEVVIIDINGAAVGDSWSQIKVVMNSSSAAAAVAGVDGMTKVTDGMLTSGVAQDTEAKAQGVSIWVTE